MSLSASLPARIVCVVAARPNLIKMTPILRALASWSGLCEPVLVHTGQHYDADMDGDFFTALALRAPDFQLQVGSASHALQTARIMERFEPVLERVAPAAVLVVGDVNSTLACALTAAKMAIPILHVEAGLRSLDRSMPEEINRCLTDQLSSLLFTSEASANENLLREGIAPAHIHLVGNVMIDTLLHELPRAMPVQQVLQQAQHPYFLAEGQAYALLTLHRPANVDVPQKLALLIDTIVKLSAEVPIVFPLHPRTRAMLDQQHLASQLAIPAIACLPPQPYLAMLGLLRNAALVLTDSGGIQEETTALGVPCLTLRDNTERPVTVTEGSNQLAGSDPAMMLSLAQGILRTGGKAGRMPPLWDGKAAHRIAAHITRWLTLNREVG